MLAFTSEVGSGSSTLYFVGHFLTKRCTASNVIPENTLTVQAWATGSQDNGVDSLFTGPVHGVDSLFTGPVDSLQACTR